MDSPSTIQRDFSLILETKLIPLEHVWLKRGRKKGNNNLFYRNDGTPLPKESFNIKNTVSIESHFFNFHRQNLIPRVMKIRQIIQDCCPAIIEKIGEDFITYSTGSKFFVLSTHTRHVWLDIRRGLSFEAPKWEHWKINSAFDLKKVKDIVK